MDSRRGLAKERTADTRPSTVFCILQMGISDGFGVQGAAGVSAFTAGSGKLLLVLNLEGTRSEW